MDLSALKLIDQLDGVRLSIKAVPGSSRDRVVGELGGALKIAVAAAPERGQANQAIVELLAAYLSISPKSIVFTRGHKSPRKEVFLRGMTGQLFLQRMIKIKEQQAEEK